jgi:hypothetical protein
MCPTLSGVRRVLPAAALLLLPAVVGCGGKNYHPVRGKVTFDDGTPFPQGTVVLLKQEGEKMVQAQGTIQPDGTFELGVDNPKEGAPPGKYRVQIIPGDMSDLDAKVRSGFDQRYANFDTSQLEFEVKPGKNEFPIQLTRRGNTRR